MESSTTEEPTQVKTTTDGIFTITVGGAAPSSTTTDLTTANLDVGGPSARMNAGLVLVRHHLFIFGGSYEQGSRLFTLCDFHSVDINKTDAWRTHVGNMPSLAWLGSDSEDSSADEDNESDDDDSDDSSDSDEMDTD